MHPMPALRAHPLRVLVLLVAACGDSPPTSSAPKGPGAFAPDFATSSAFFTNMSAMKKGLPSSPHGLIRIYYSSNVRGVIDAPSFTVPEGTVAIKVQDRDANGAVDG